MQVKIDRRLPKKKREVEYIVLFERVIIINIKQYKNT